MPELVNAMRLDSNSPITWESASRGLREFARWWWSELRDLIAPNWLALVQSLFERRTITLDGPVWQIHARSLAAGTLTLDPAAPDMVLHDLVARLDPACLNRRIDARIAESDGLVRNIQLPAAAEQRLHSVVGLQLDRLSPLRGEDVRFDCRRIGPERDGMIDVEIAIVPKTTLQAYESRLRNVGLVPAGYRFGDTPLVLAPVQTDWTRQERVQLALGALAVLLWIGAVVLTPLSRDAELADLAGQVELLRTPATAAAAARDQLRRLQGPVAAASARLAKPNALDVLRLLSELLPDDVQLTNLTIDGDTVQLNGTGTNPPSLMALLNRSGRFRQARLIGPGIVGERASFEIEMSLVGARMRAMETSP